MPPEILIILGLSPHLQRFSAQHRGLPSPPENPTEIEGASHDSECHIQNLPASGNQRLGVPSVCESNTELLFQSLS